MRFAPDFFWVSYDVCHQKKNVSRHDFIAGWCRQSGSNSIRNDQISEIDMLVRLSLEGFWIGLGEYERCLITQRERKTIIGKTGLAPRVILVY